MMRRFSVCGCLMLCILLFPTSRVLAIQCTVTSSIPPTMRAEGITELAADVIIDCTDGPAATMLVSFQLFINANLTSRVFDPNKTEVLLLIDDPVNGVLGTNVFAGARVRDIAGGTRENSVVWTDVPFTPVPPGGRRRFRIKNIRVNATGIGSSLGLPGQAVAFLSVFPPGAILLNNPQQIVGYVVPGLKFSVQDGADPNKPLAGGGAVVQPGVPAATAPAAYLRFKEGFPGAFRTRGETSPTPVATASCDYGTEGGYRFGLGFLQTAGWADFGTRMAAAFANIPRGVHVWVGLTDGAGRTRLTASESAGYQPVPATAVANGVPVAEITLLNGAGTAVWELLSNPPVPQTYDVPVFFTTDPDIGGGVGTVAARFAPASTTTTAGTVAPVPRFADTATPVRLVSGALSVSCTSAEGPGRAGVPYSAECTASGGTAPYNWSVRNGALPDGITLSSGTGVTVRIAGVPTTAGPYSYLVSVADSSAPPQEASKPYSGVVQERLALEIPGSASAIAAGSDGSVYIIGTASCDANGCPLYRWTGNMFQVVTGTGSRIAVDSTGRVWLVNKSGGIRRFTEPGSLFSDPVAGSASDVAAGGNRVYIIGTASCSAAGCAPLLYNGLSFEQMQGRGTRIAADPAGRLWMVDAGGAIYRYQSATTGAAFDRIPGTATAIAASPDGAVYIVGTAPCDANGCTVAKFDGAAFVPITGLTAAEIAAERTDVLWLVTKGHQILRYAPNDSLRVTCSAAGPTTAGVAYSNTCTAAGAVTPVQWSITDGALPAGLALAGAGVTATISGTPAAAGNYRFTVTAQDSFIVPRRGSQAFSGILAPPPAPVTVSCVPAAGPALTRVDYSTTCTASNGLAPLQWSIPAGALPAGLTLGATTGASTSIRGTPTTPGAYQFTVAVTDGGGRSASQSFSGAVADAAITLNCATGLGPSMTGMAYTETCTTSGGVPPYRWSVSQGRLPDGLALSATSGAAIAIAGTPSAEGQYGYTIAVTDAGTPPQSAVRSFTGTLARYQFRTFNAAGFREGTVAPDSIASLYGSGLALRTESYNGQVTTLLGGTTVKVVDSLRQSRDAQLFYASSGQVNFLVPAETAAGVAEIIVSKPGVAGVLSGSVTVAGVAPGIFTVSGGSTVPAAFYLRVTAANERIQDYTFDPATLAPAAIPREAGDEIYLLLYGTGFRRHAGRLAATANGQAVPVLGAVAQSEFAGLDQVNIGPLPASLASGLVTVRLQFDGLEANEITVRLR